MRLIDMRDASEAQRSEAARILIEALAHVPSAWKDPAEARAEVDTFVADPERMAWLAIDDERVLGWIGRIAEYSHSWELHPLVVDPRVQRSGVGTALVAALEEAAAEAGMLTVTLGSDDDYGGTNIFGKNLGPEPLRALAELAPAAGHAFTFYRQLGYGVSGVVPDANGPGKHDILMSKQIGRRGEPK